MWLDRQLLKFFGFLDNISSYIDRLFQPKPKKNRKKYNGNI